MLVGGEVHVGAADVAPPHGDEALGLEDAQGLAAAGGPTSYWRTSASSGGTTSMSPSRIWLRRLSATTSAMRGSRARRRSSPAIARSGSSIGVSTAIAGAYLATLTMIASAAAVAGRPPAAGRTTVTEPLAPRPLEGIRVLAVEQMIAAPWATQLLARLGADVVKVEHPTTGDSGRGSTPTVTGDDGRPVGATFIRNNLNKRSIGVDLKRGADLVLDLAERCDVFVQNSKAGSIERMGLGYEAVSGPGTRA